MSTPTPPEIPPRLPLTTRRALEDLVTTTAVRLSADREPDLDALDSLAKLTASLAALITARTDAHNRRT
jgi:hypothetical protein